MWHRKFLSTTCCISNRRLFDDGIASEDGDVCFAVVVVVLLLFAINCIFVGVLFDVINQGIHLDVILTLAKFYPTYMVLKQHGLKDSMYFEREKTRYFCFEIYIVCFGIYQV